MNLEQKVMDGMKEAMKARNEASLRSYRAIKAEIIKAKQNPVLAEKSMPMQNSGYCRKWLSNEKMH